MNRSALVFSVLGSILVSACGGNEGLTMRGGVEITGSGLSTGIGPFEQETRLDSIEATPSDRITGSCEMRRTLGADGLQQWSVIVTINAPTEAGLSSITISQDTGALPEAAVVSATITQRDYSSQPGTCALDVPWAVGDDGAVSLLGDCDLSDVDGNVVTAAIDMQLEGCLVAPGTD